MDFARKKLMLASFLTLVASGIGFATRTAAGNDWETLFGLGGEDFGTILGYAFLGFGLVIFFGGMIVEALGYKLVLIISLFLHLVSGVMLFAAGPVFNSYVDADPEAAKNMAFWIIGGSAFVFSLCQGLYESVINPLIADLYPENKTHYLNILHAGWPAGMIIGGVFAFLFIGPNAILFRMPWDWALASFALVVVICIVMVLPEKFPKTVASASEGGFGKAFACFASIPFIVLILLHGLIGYMELGVDSWMTKLMENLLDNSIIILIYTSMLMFGLRFFAGPIVHRINPIGLLLISSVIACLGLLWLGMPTESLIMVFAAATFYSLGKAFLWPTMLAVAGERYPQSGAIAMGALGAAGMLTVGQIGGPRIGVQQGYYMSQHLEEDANDTFTRFKAEKPIDSWGYEYTPVDPTKLGVATAVSTNEDGNLNLASIENSDLISDDDKAAMLANATMDIPAVKKANLAGGRDALRVTAQLPFAMAIGFAGLLVYFLSQGGYKVLTVNENGEVVPADHDHASSTAGTDAPSSSVGDLAEEPLMGEGD